MKHPMNKKPLKPLFLSEEEVNCIKSLKGEFESSCELIDYKSVGIDDDDMGLRIQFETFMEDELKQLIVDGWEEWLEDKTPPQWYMDKYNLNNVEGK